MSKYILAPSILSADFGKLAKDVNEAEKAGASWLHIDVMDGVFVPNISLGIPVVKSLRKYSDMFFDTHLMIVNPEKYIERFIQAGADGITFHIEATEKPEECIDIIKSCGKKAGIAISPDTPVSSVEKYLDKVDMVLAMTVYPGFGGQKYIESVNEKLKQLRAICGEDYNIEVDGGITADNIDAVHSMGANVMVAGSAVFNDDIAGSVKKMTR